MSDIAKTFAILLVAAVPFSAAPAAGLRANGPGHGIAYGNLTLTPQIWLSGEYDSNIYWSNYDEQSDYIYTVSPGIKLELPWDREKNVFKAWYRADLIYFQDHPRENHQDHTADGYLRYRVSDYTLELEDLYRKTSSRFDTEFRERIRRTDNLARARLSAEYNAFEVQAEYRNFYRNFDTDRYERYDRDENIADLYLLYRVASKTQALVEYVYDVIDYRTDHARDGQYHEILAGFRGNLTSRLTGEAKIGYQSRKYDQPYWNDYGGLVGYVSLEEEFSRSTGLSVGWERTLQESTYVANSYYQINRVWARVSQQLVRKLRGFAEASYGNYYYPNPDGVPGGNRRNDDAYFVSAGLVYSLQEYLNISLVYGWRRRDSNVPDLDYTDNRVGLVLYAYY